MTLTASLRRFRAEKASELFHRSGFHFPLTEAAVCNQCEAVFNLKERTCPACGSGNVMAIARWLK